MRKFALWLAANIIPQAMCAAIAFLLGYYHGHEAGRIEMKCAILAVVEGLGSTPAPGTITLGCDKRPSPTLIGRDAGGKSA